jgi:transposase
MQRIVSLGRVSTQLGHDVRMVPARYVKPYVRRGKSDAVMPRRSVRQLADVLCLYKDRGTTVGK